MALSLLVLGLSGVALAGSPAAIWGAIKTPSPGAPRAIGDYSGGCLQGGQALPLEGPGYQVMHPGRLRYYGHPALLDFVQRLGAAADAGGHGPLLVGDLAQPRGGRASGGHASHQSGLDVDIWFWHPRAAEKGPLPTGERERLKARSILNGRKGEIRERWKSKVAGTLELTARDRRVERVFVHPIIKRELCERTQGDRAWLRQIRPWYGHDDHFHVRLACPADSPDCTPQDPVGEGDGCDELSWWFDAEAQAERKRERSRYRRKVVGGARWPAQCDALLEQPK